MNTAVRFEKEDKSRTYLILDDETSDLLGYFSITFKEVTYPQKAISKTATKSAGAILDERCGLMRVRAYLIGQIGKNKSINNNPLNLELILEEVYGIINEARGLVGGRAVILECADEDRLVGHYEKHGFRKIDMEPKHNGDITMYTVIKG